MPKQDKMFPRPGSAWKHKDGEIWRYVGETADDDGRVQLLPDTPEALNESEYMVFEDEEGLRLAVHIQEWDALTAHGCAPIDKDWGRPMCPDDDCGLPKGWCDH